MHDLALPSSGLSAGAGGACLFGLSLCSGAGGLDLGLTIAVPGYRAVGYVERDAFAASILVARMEDASLDGAPVWDDVASFDGCPWKRHDVQRFGLPDGYDRSDLSGDFIERCHKAIALGKRRGEFRTITRDQVFSSLSHLGKMCECELPQDEPSFDGAFGSLRKVMEMCSNAFRRIASRQKKCVEIQLDRMDGAKPSRCS